jgi:hypothetical protein
MARQKLVSIGLLSRVDRSIVFLDGR